MRTITCKCGIEISPFINKDGHSSGVYAKTCIKCRNIGKKICPKCLQPRKDFFKFTKRGVVIKIRKICQPCFKRRKNKKLSPTNKNKKTAML